MFHAGAPSGMHRSAPRQDRAGRVLLTMARRRHVVRRQSFPQRVMILKVDDGPSEQHMIVADADMSLARQMAWEVSTKKWPFYWW